MLRLQRGKQGLLDESPQITVSRKHAAGSFWRLVDIKAQVTFQDTAQSQSAEQNQFYPRPPLVQAHLKKKSKVTKILDGSLKNNPLQI